MVVLIPLLSPIFYGISSLRFQLSYSLTQLSERDHHIVIFILIILKSNPQEISQGIPYDDIFSDEDQTPPK